MDECVAKLAAAEKRRAQITDLVLQRCLPSGSRSQADVSEAPITRFRAPSQQSRSRAGTMSSNDGSPRPLGFKNGQRRAERNPSIAKVSPERIRDEETQSQVTEAIEKLLENTLAPASKATEMGRPSAASKTGTIEPTKNERILQPTNTTEMRRPSASKSARSESRSERAPEPAKWSMFPPVQAVGGRNRDGEQNRSREQSRPDARSLSHANIMTFLDDSDVDSS